MLKMGCSTLIFAMPPRCYSSFLLTLLISVFLWGCSSTSNTSHSPLHSQQPITESDTSSVSDDTDLPYVDFPPETMYALLIAEYALRNGDYSSALALYTQEAKTTRDPNITAYATRLAQLLKADTIALNNAQLWLESSPDNTEARFNTAMLLARENKPLEALEQMQWLLQNHKESNFALVAASAAKQPDITLSTEALTRIKALIAQGFDEVSLYTGAAILERRLENYPEALAFVKQARTKDPEDERIGLLQMALLQTLDKNTEAVNLAGQLAQQHPNQLPLQLQYARMLSDTNPEKALERFSSLNILYPNNPDILFPLALLALKDKQYAVSEGYLKQLLSHSTYRSAAYYYLGYIAEDNQKNHQAIEYFLQVSHGQDYIDSQRRLVNLYTAEGNITAAQKHLHILRQLQPDDIAQLAIIEANILSQQKKLTEALHVLNNSLEILPNNMPLHYARAMLLGQQGHIDQAEADLLFIINRDSNDANALNALGYTLASQTTRYQEALDYIHKALALEPENPAIIDSMGWVQYKLGNNKKALHYLKIAFQQFPDAEIAAHLGEVLWVMGKQKEAVAIWKQILESDPNNALILNTIERLQPPAPKAAP